MKRVLLLGGAVAIVLAACGDEDINTEDDGRVACTRVDDCAAGQLCGDDGFCAADPDAPVPCSAAADCTGGSRCLIAAAGSEGVCSNPADYNPCGEDDDCPAGLLCELNGVSGQGECVPTDDGTAGYACAADADCGDYLCDSDRGICFGQCTESVAQCPDDYACVGADDDNGVRGACVPTGGGGGGGGPVVSGYTMFIVTSEVTEDSADVQDTTTPGPDIDGVALFSGGQTILPNMVTVLEGSAPTNSQNSDATWSIERNAMSGLGPSYDCDLNGEYYSMGARDGFLAFTFPGGRSIETGDTLAVYEMSRTSCPRDIDTSFDDSYNVYVHNGDVPASAADVRATTCLVGQGTAGGYWTFPIDLGDCE